MQIPTDGEAFGLMLFATVLGALGWWVKSLYVKLMDINERIIRLEERAKRRDREHEEEHGNGDGYLD